MKLLQFLNKKKRVRFQFSSKKNFNFSTFLMREYYRIDVRREKCKKKEAKKLIDEKTW